MTSTASTLEDVERFGRWHSKVCTEVTREVRHQLAGRASSYEADFRGHTPSKLLEALAGYCVGGGDDGRQPGKMFRASFVELGYLAAGGDGENIQKIRPLQAAVEILHTSILIHDDIIDRSDFRRSGPTFHRIFEAQLRADSTMDSEHYGRSLAMLAGDVGCFIAMEVAQNRAIPTNARGAALKMLFGSIIQTALGEVLDVEIAANPIPTENEIFCMTKFKTANYTVLAPLQLGELAADGENTSGETMRGFAQELGQAYQLRDDYLGIFGSKIETGKPEESDVREGKKTYLWLWARERAQRTNPSALKRIDELYGCKHADFKALQEIRHIFRELNVDTAVKAEVNRRVAAASDAVGGFVSNQVIRSLFWGLCEKIRIQ